MMARLLPSAVWRGLVIVVLVLIGSHVSSGLVNRWTPTLAEYAKPVAVALGFASALIMFDVLFRSAHGRFTLFLVVLALPLGATFERVTRYVFCTWSNNWSQNFPTRHVEAICYGLAFGICLWVARCSFSKLGTLRTWTFRRRRGSDGNR